MSEAVKLFASSPLQRIVIIKQAVDGDGPSQFAGVLSQSSVAAFLTATYGTLVTPKPAPGLWKNGEMTLNELGLVGGGVVSVSPEDEVIDALYAMHQHGISSVAIVDRAAGHEQIVGSISMTDLKEIFSKRGGYKHL